MINAYAKAYTEVLEIIKYLPEEEYNNIPQKKIDYYRKYKDNNYKYIYDNNKLPSEQEISREAIAIMVTLFRDYFATPTQKEKLQKLLEKNEQKYQEELREKYSQDNLFKKKAQYINKVEEENMQLKAYKKENVLHKLKSFIIGIFNKNVT